MLENISWLLEVKMHLLANTVSLRNQKKKVRKQ